MKEIKIGMKREKLGYAKSRIKIKKKN